MTQKRSSRSSKWESRTNAWISRHRLFLDFLTSVPFILFFAVIAQESGGAGLLLAQSQWAAFWWTMAYIIPLTVRHKYPDACAWITVSLLTLRLLFGPIFLVSDISALACLFAAIARGNPRFRWHYVACGILLPPLFCLLDIRAQTMTPLLGGKNSGSLADPSIDIVFAIIGVVLSGATIAYAQHSAVVAEHTRLLQERNKALELSNQQKAEEAAIAERARLARDMHDVAAHTLSILVVLADGGRYAGAHNSTVALQTMRTIKSEADKALRNTSALFMPADRADSTDSPHSPTQADSSNPADVNVSASQLRVRRSNTRQQGSQLLKMRQLTVQDSLPDYSRIDALVQEANTSGGGRLHVIRTVEGSADLTAMITHPLLSRALYRLVEESLSNVRKYAGLGDGRAVHVHVSETWVPAGDVDHPGSVRIRVRDDGQGAAAANDGHSAGYGLIGMRERVEACGGTLHVGPISVEEGGGFAVEATIPLPAPAADDATSQNAGSRKVGSRFLHRVWSWFSQWWRHGTLPINGFAVSDVVISAIICFVTLASLVPSIIDSWPLSYEMWVTGVYLVGTLGCAIPIAFLHRWPEQSAAVTALFMGLTSLAGLVLAEIPPFVCYVCGLIAFYALAAFGPGKAMRWARPVASVLIVVAGVQEGVFTYGRQGDVGILMSVPRFVFAVVSTAVMCGAILVMVASLGRLRRDRGEDPVLLASHQQALLRQQEQAASLAARRERERISAQIHVEVTQALRKVSVFAGSAIERLEEIDARSQGSGSVSEEDSATIVRLFTQTAQVSRDVLARIRELIGVLRRNETDAETQRVLLAPVDPVDTVDSESAGQVRLSMASQARPPAQSSAQSFSAQSSAQASEYSHVQSEQGTSGEDHGTQ